MLHDLKQFQDLVRSSNWCYLNIRRPSLTLEKLKWNDSNVEQILCALTAANHIKISLNCDVEEFVGCDSVDADMYRIYWDEQKCKGYTRWSAETIELSLKIAIVTDDEGQAAGLVTLHLSGGI